MNKLNPLDKIFFVSAIILTVILSYLSYHTVDALKSADSLDITLYDYHTYDSFLVLANPVSFVLLLILSNIGYLKHQRGSFFLITFCIFAVFATIDYAYISDEFFRFRKRSGLWKGEFSLSFLMGLFLCVIAGALTLINYLILATYKKYSKKS